MFLKAFNLEKKHKFFKLCKLNKNQLASCFSTKINARTEDSAAIYIYRLLREKLVYQEFFSLFFLCERPFRYAKI